MSHSAEPLPLRTGRGERGRCRVVGKGLGLCVVC